MFTAGNAAIKKRVIVPSAERKKMLSLLRRKLRNPSFFEELFPLGLDIGFVKSPVVKGFSFNRMPLAIKYTGGQATQGQKYRQFRNIFKTYHKALGAGLIKAELHILRSPQVYGRIGNYLIMEKINELLPANKKEELTQNNAYLELVNNFRKLKEKGLIRGEIQLNDYMLAGNTNPENPAKGKWIIFHPYDIL
ncbi:MAG: hypothetical protein V1494_01370 [Candidatus Diapherotrites archaeon]